MLRLGPRDLRLVSDGLRDTYGVRDLDGFAGHIISLLPKLVPSDITTYNEVNPPRRRATWAWNPAVDVADELRRAFERHIPEHPLIAHYQRTSDCRAHKISDFLTLRQFHRLALYNEFYRRVDVEHQMAFPLPSRPPIVIGIALNRSRLDFSERDRLVLDLLRPHLVQAYRNAEAVTRLREKLAEVRQVVEALPLGVVALRRDRHVGFMTERARRWLAEYFGGELRPARRLPASVEAWARHQERLLRADDVPPPRQPLVVERDGQRLVLRLLSDDSESLLLLEEQPVALRAQPLEALGLTRREAEVLAWVAEGKTNAEVATILGLSPRTVQKHLEHIYLKLGVETRTAAAAHALGQA